MTFLRIQDCRIRHYRDVFYHNLTILATETKWRWQREVSLRAAARNGNDLTTECYEQKQARFILYDHIYKNRR